VFVATFFLTVRFPPESDCMNLPGRRGRVRATAAAFPHGAAALLALTIAACGEVPPPTQHLAMNTAGSLDRHLTMGDDLRLEENDTVINVLTRVNLDRDGGFLVADEQENQIRAYAANGRLLRHFGRRGAGPKEFVFLHRAMRLGSGRVLGVDYQGKGVVFDSAGRTALHTFVAPVAPVQHARLVNDTLLLLGGRAVPRRGRETGARLHLWNLARDTVVRSFFTPPLAGPAHRLAATVGGFVGTDLRGDTVAAVFAVSDTIYFFGLDGRKLGQRPIPFRHFRRLREGGAVPGHNASVIQAREWAGTYSMVTDVFWLRDGGFLVQYQDRVGSTPHWRLLRMRKDGTRVFEIVDSPMLLAVDPRDDTLYLMKPGALTAETWTLARLAG
jgi:hypothetical protein